MSYKFNPFTGKLDKDTTAAAGSLTDGDKGDITVASSGASWTIDAGVVSYAKMQDVSATDKILGRSTSGAGDVEEISCTAAGRALLDDADAAAQRTTLGLGTAATSASGDFFAASGVSTFGATLIDDADAAASRTTLGLGTAAVATAPTGTIVGTTDTQTLTNKTLGNLTETVFAITDAATVALDPANGPIQTWTLGGNRTATAANFSAGESMTLGVTAGSNTLTWPTMTWVGGSAPTLSTSGTTYIVMWEVGQTLYGANVGDVA